MVWTYQKKVSLAFQALYLQRIIPSSISKFKRSKLTWTGEIQPTPLSQKYTVRIEYKLDESPRADLISPKLERRDGNLPPHLYPEERLCLYLPGMNEWNGQMLLADTIVPWIAEWLMHYEIWLATGEWCGGGVHPGDEAKLEIEAKPKNSDSKKWRRHHRHPR